MKKIFSIFICVSLLFSLVACDISFNKDHTVTFDSDGGSAVSSQNVEDGKNVIKPDDPTKEGYVFEGWYIDDEKWSFYGYTVCQDIVLKAKWIIQSYKLTILVEENGDVYRENTYEYGSEVSLSIPYKEGYSFVKWNVDLNGVMPAKDTTIYPIWEEIQKGPESIFISVPSTKMQINSSMVMTYTITPAKYQIDDVTISIDNQIVTYTKNGINQIIINSSTNVGTVKFTIKTSNGFVATKTIKVQKEEVKAYPDLGRYNIKIAQSESGLGDYDVNLTKATEDKYGYYSKADREYKIKALNEIEENYNCTISVVPYPSDATWGPARWQYILTQAQNDSPETDFYVCPEGQIPGFVVGNAILDLTDWYAKYGNKIMSNISIQAGTYKQRLYTINDQETNIYNILGYNVGLLEKIQKIDSTIKSPAKMYLENNWNYNTFKEYCIKVQNALNKMNTESEKYYALSGYSTYYWIGLVNAAGVKVLDTTQLKVNLTGTTETLAAQTLRDIYAAGCTDPAQQVDEAVVSWNNGHSLFNTGDFWFVKNGERWTKTLWGTEEETRYGYVPYPTSPSSIINYVGTNNYESIVMASGREWAYQGFGDECTAENIYRAYMDYLTTARSYYKSSESYSKEDELRNTASQKFGDEDSVKAYIKIMLGTKQEDGTYVGGIEEYGFYDPYIENSNSVVGNYGATGTLAGDIKSFICGSESNWKDAIGKYESTVTKALVDSYG